jgi:hypothetical protein
MAAVLDATHLIMHRSTARGTCGTVVAAIVMPLSYSSAHVQFMQYTVRLHATANLVWTPCFVTAVCTTQVDILINNAGLALSLSSVADHDIEVRPTYHQQGTRTASICRLYGI